MEHLRVVSCFFGVDIGYIHELGSWVQEYELPPLDLHVCERHFVRCILEKDWQFTCYATCDGFRPRGTPLSTTVQTTAIVFSSPKMGHTVPRLPFLSPLVVCRCSPLHHHSCGRQVRQVGRIHRRMHRWLALHLPCFVHPFHSHWSLANSREALPFPPGPKIHRNVFSSLDFRLLLRSFSDD